MGTTSKVVSKPKQKLGNILLGLLFVVGLLVFLYPSISNYINSFYQAGAIAEYSHTVDEMGPAQIEEMFKEADAYNKKLQSKSSLNFNLNAEEMAEYDSLLNPSNTGMMGFITIDSLNVELPVYHGIEDTVLQRFIGHLPGTSLPTGEIGTHVVLSGHRGLPESKLFTDLDRMKEGDIFSLHVLGRNLAYKVDQIRIVEPREVSDLKIEPNEAYCTLITCTPYGINSHRLLVRGHRVAYPNQDSILADALRLDPLLLTSAFSLFVCVLALGVVFLNTRTKFAKRLGQIRKK